MAWAVPMEGETEAHIYKHPFTPGWAVPSHSPGAVGLQRGSRGVPQEERGSRGKEWPWGDPWMQPVAGAGAPTQARSNSRGKEVWSEAGGASGENGAVSAGRSVGSGSGGWAARRG